MIDADILLQSAAQGWEHHEEDGREIYTVDSIIQDLNTAPATNSKAVCKVAHWSMTHCNLESGLERWLTKNHQVFIDISKDFTSISSGLALTKQNFKQLSPLLLQLKSEFVPDVSKAKKSEDKDQSNLHRLLSINLTDIVRKSNSFIDPTNSQYHTRLSRVRASTLFSLASKSPLKRRRKSSIFPEINLTNFDPNNNLTILEEELADLDFGETEDLLETLEHNLSKKKYEEALANLNDLKEFISDDNKHIFTVKNYRKYEFLEQSFLSAMVDRILLVHFEKSLDLIDNL
jgi:hypothetical protein